jgi:hypothetical protein
MVSIVEHFGRRKPEPQLRQDPQMPAVQRPIPPAPHEDSARALAFVTRLNDDVAELRQENGRLRADLNLALMRCRDLERDRAVTLNDLEVYRRYSVEVRTHLSHIMDVVQRANEAALDAGDRQLAQEKAEQVIVETEREMRAASEPRQIDEHAEHTSI